MSSSQENVNNEENNNVPPPPKSPPPAPISNAPKPVNTNTPKRVTVYLPQQRGEAVTFRQYTVETKIIDDTSSISI